MTSVPKPIRLVMPGGKMQASTLTTGETRVSAPTSHRCPNGLRNPACLCVPQGARWSRISSPDLSAPAATARLMNASGSSTRTSTRWRSCRGPRGSRGRCWRRGEEEGRPVELQADDRPQVPERGRADRGRLPGCRDRRVRNGKHERDHRTGGGRQAEIAGVARRSVAKQEQSTNVRVVARLEELWRAASGR